MKKIKQWLKDTFDPETFNDLDIYSIAEALNDPSVRTAWLQWLLSDMKRVNLDVDRKLLGGMEYGLLDLCARRKAFQDILEGVLAAKRKVVQDAKQEPRPNPRAQGLIDLDRVTA